MPKSKKTTKKSVKTTTPVVADEPVQQVDSVESAPATMQDQFTALLAQLSALRSQLTSVTSQVRALSKRTDREIRAAQKASRKKRKSGNRAPSGFVKPTKISKELATFLQKPAGTEMARTEVTREINKYIRDNSLQDKDNGRKINPDAKLSKLLSLTKKDELTYFNLQRYMSPHFAKAGKSLPSSA